MNSDFYVLPLADCHDLTLVGGKALNLGLLINEGFCVPDGFVVTTAAYRHARTSGGDGVPADLAATIIKTYRAFGSPTVAVRSSATAEDLADASVAGQYETILDVQGEEALLAAIRQCWASLDSPRVRSYLAGHRIAPEEVAMGVVVQEMVAADVAGVLFTANPQIGACGEMLIEASWGLGEAVVSGLVQPDTLVLDRATGAVKQATIADKQVWIKPGTHGAQPVPAERRRRACLNSQNVRDLWILGQRVMDYYGKPQDTEWAMRDGKLYLLQARAITTLEDAEAYEHALQATRAQLVQARKDGRGDWVRHNLCETLPQPTPLTWSVIRRFMTGDGGFGTMYRMVGFEPTELVRHEGFLDLIAGRIYADLARAPQMFFAGFPFRYDLNLLRTNPDAAQGPPTIPAGSLTARFRGTRRLAKVNARLEALAAAFDRQLDADWIPAFSAWVETEKKRDLGTLDTAGWLELWQARERRVMDEFAPLSLMPSLICAMALARMRSFVAENFWDEDPDALVNLLAGGSAPDRTVHATAALLDLAEGHGCLADWLAANGHRAPEEFDLATPRWHERPEVVKTMAGHLQGGANPLELHQRRVEAANQRSAELKTGLPARERREFQHRLDLVHRYLPYRENGKYFLMRGYELLRELALEAGRRLCVETPNDVFFLSFEELRDALNTGFAPLHLIDQRRRERAALARLNPPFILTGDDIAALGEPPKLAAGTRCPAFSISAGHGRGPARLIFKPEDAGDLGDGYILICPSTDPNWTPLFVKAAGVIMERGGTLSHGAVVAREMGIPAVVVDGATTLFKENEILTVDGHRGAVFRSDIAESAIVVETAAEPNDTRIPLQLTPPPAGARERRSATVRNLSLALWGAYLFAVFILPSPWLKLPTFHLLDTLLLPAVDALGRPAVVALVAAVLATFTMVGQRLFTDHRRLLIAKDRANQLRHAAAKLPKDAPRRQAMLALAAPVQTRIALAAFVPLALILGPLVMSFLWFPERIDPASWNASPGATVFVTALVDGDCQTPVTLDAAAPLRLADTTPATQSLPPIRTVLEKLLATWRQPSTLPDNLPWELREAAQQARETKLAELGDFLKKPVPPQPLSWTLLTPVTPGGAYPIAIRAGDVPPLHTRITLGRRVAPEPKEDLGDGKGPVHVVHAMAADAPVRQVKVIYREPKKAGADVFWKPADRLHGWLGQPGWLAPWLIVYLFAYLPAMIIWRQLLRIP